MEQMIKRSNYKILDCTLRDGGYHNNWFFSRKLINVNLKRMSKEGIEFIGVGFCLNYSTYLVCSILEQKKTLNQ
tara:strand:- start:1464 stop:1685 length:222 start_codon:yes stop_codon:yes gene_type:complete